MQTYSEHKTNANKVIFKNLLEILTRCKDFPKKSGNVSIALCSQFIIQKVNNMLNEYNYDSISLHLDKSYYSPLIESTVYSWISGKRSIDRISIFKIAYGLRLPLEENAIFSCQALFNRVFNQRYCLKHADEIALCYCLKNNASYYNALEIIATYKQSEKNYLANPENQSDKIKPQSTKNLFKDALESKNIETITEFLIDSIPSFISETTAINDELNSRTAIFNDENVIKNFNKKYDRIKSSLNIKESYFSIIEKSRDDYDREQFQKDIETKYPNFYNYVVVSDEIFDNAQKQLKLINYLLLHPNKLELFLREDALLEENKDSLTVKDYYDSVGCPAILQDIDITMDISAQLQTIKSDLIMLLEIIEPMHFSKLHKDEKQKEGSKNVEIQLDTMNFNNPSSISSELFVKFNTDTTSKKSNYYESMRKLIVTISFFHYFNDYIHKSHFQPLSLLFNIYLLLKLFICLLNFLLFFKPQTILEHIA